MRRNTLYGCGIFLAGAVLGALGVWSWPTTAGPLQIEIASQTPDGPAERADTLSLRFDRNIAAPEQVGKAIAEAPFYLEPPRRGAWTFTATDRIAYRLDEKLETGRSYTLKATDACDRALGAKLIGDRSAIFKTTNLQVAQCGIQSSDRTHVNVEIEFNQPVNGAALEKALHVRDKKKNDDLAPSLLTRQNTKTHLVRFARPPSTGAVLSLDATLTGADGDLPMGETFRQQLTCHEALEVEYVNCWSDRQGDGATVRLNFNNRLKDNAKVPLVTVSPPVAGVTTSTYYDSLSIEGPFECGKRYTITVAAGLVGRNGTISTEAVTKTVRVPDRDARLRLMTGRGVLSPVGHMLLDVETINYDDINTTITRLYPNNLVAHLHGGNAESTGKVVSTNKLHVNGERNALVKSVLRLGDLIERQPGIYHVRIKGDKNYWDSDDAVIAVSDLAITARKQRDGVFCWITSIAESAPVGDVKLTAYSFTNQVLGEATTDKQGRAVLELPTGSTSDNGAWVVVAEKVGDLSYVLLDRDNWSPEQNDLTGRPPIDTYDAFVYTERGAYRPGDMIHLSGILRDKIGNAPPPFPLTIIAKRPDGRALVCETIEPDAGLDGFFHLNIPTPETAQLGRYTFDVTIPGSQQTIGMATALVETILPVRIELAAHSAKDTYVGKVKPNVSVGAKYLFGKPAGGLRATLSGQYVRQPFKAPEFDGFVFEPHDLDAEQVIDEVEATLDAAGNANLEIPAATGSGLWEARVSVSVTEPGSRSVSQRLRFTSDPDDRHLGIRLPIGNSAPAGDAIDVQWAQVTGAGDWAAGMPLQLVVERIEYDWAIRDTGAGMRWESTERKIPTLKQALNQSDATPSGTMPVTLTMPGQYQVRLEEPSSGLIADWPLYVHRRGAHDESFAVALPENVEIRLDSPRYVPGNLATATIRAGLKGTLLVALETDRVIWSDAIKMEGNTQTVEVPIPADLRRDAFLTASVIRPLNLNATKWKPLRARGIARVPVTFEDRRLALELDAPERIRPGVDVTILARLTDVSHDGDTPAVVQIFAVDEGLLLPTAFATPDALAHFFAPRSATVELYDLFNGLLPDYARPRSTNQIGAGDDEMSAAEVAASDALMRSPVSMRREVSFVAWQKAIPVNDAGEVAFSFTAPPSQGRLRVMAVAVAGDRYASVSRPLLLSAPLMVEAQWPRFLAPEDEVWVPAKLFNQSDKDREIELTIDNSNGIEFASIESDTYTVGADSTLTVWLKLRATQPGRGTIRLSARWPLDDEDQFVTAVSSGTIPIRALTSIRTVSYTKRIPAGTDFKMSPPGGFFNDTLQSRIQVMPTPAAELLPAYEALLDYPYGCLEQTSSRVHGLICARDMIQPSADERADIDDRINAGLVRIWSMQTAGGGLAFWPNNTEPSLWGTTYASQVLLAAQAAGYDVNADLLDGIQRYLSRTADRLATSNGDDEQDRRRELLPTIAFMLAKLEAAPLGILSNLSNEAEALDLEARSYLARAWLAAGHRERAGQLLTGDVLQVATSRALGAGRITSSIRQKAALLDALLDYNAETEPEHQVVAQLLAARKNSQWHSTLENATCLSALARYYQRQPMDAAFAGRLFVGDADGIEFDQDTPTRQLTIPAGAGVEIESAGTGSFFVSCTHRGLAAAPLEQPHFDSGLTVRREWLGSDGKPVDVDAMTVGDLIRVRLTVSVDGLADGDVLPNVAIIDALPAACEAENPALATSAEGETDGSLTPDSVQFEDDRVLVFATVSNEATTFEYHLRIVGRGDFTLPPIEANCMYDGAIASRHGGGRIVVTQ